MRLSKSAHFKGDHDVGYDKSHEVGGGKGEPDTLKPKQPGQDYDQGNEK
jgi:hypothetical protein